MPVKLPYHELDLSDVSTYPLASRPSKVHHEDLARPLGPGATLSEFLDALPRQLAGTDLRDVVQAIAAARRRSAPILWGFGGHVIKVGLGPLLVDLMARGFVSAVATNGAGLIHDFEMAIGGMTSEDVEAALGPGRFGMATETGRDLNEIIKAGVAKGQGIGQAVGEWLLEQNPPHGTVSVVTQAARLGVPVTVHLALGTDTVHMHPSASGAALGEGSLRDFRYFAASVCRLTGGVYLNCGSAVVLPEVFLKAVALARNRGVDLTGLTTVSLDFIRQYRAETNVVRRPTAGVGRGYALVGHHEILIPLLAGLLVAQQ